MACNFDNFKVDIILASYNGSTFIEEQLYSILSQTHNNFSVIISDDGSTDDTVEKILRIANEDDRVKLVNKERVGGVAKNFNKALSFSDADYVMLSDQDDVWCQNKIELMLSFLIKHEEQLGAKSPVLCYSDLILVDQDCNVIANSFYKVNKYNPIHNQDVHFLSWRSTIYGCTCIFNKSCATLAYPFPNGIPMHDHWLALVALKFGGLYFLDNPTILYRQHSNNVVGGAAFNKSLFMKLKKTKKLIAGIKIAQQGSLVLRAWLGDERGKIKFFGECIWPYFHEKKLYSSIFTFFHFFGK